VMVRQRIPDRLGCRADIDEKRGVIGNETGCCNADRLFLRGRNLAPRLVFHVLRTTREGRSTMNTRQDLCIAEVVQILADRLRRDGEMRSQILDENAAVRFGQCDYFRLAIAQEHEPCLFHLRFVLQPEKA